MWTRWWLIGLLAATMALTAGAAAQEKGDKKGKPPAGVADPNVLSLEILALRTLRTLRATPAQMKGLQALLKPDFVKKVERAPARVSAPLRKNLRLLRDALVRDDEEGFEKYGKRVEILREDDEEVFEDDVPITRAAIEPARQALRLFTARQVLILLQTLDEDRLDPPQVLLDALNEGLGCKPEDWQKIRDAASARVVWLVGPLAKDAAKTRTRIRAWLDEKHKLSAEDLEMQKPKLADAALQEFAAKIGPATLLNNSAWYAMTELLCNPRLPAVLRARLKNVSSPNPGAP
jgi:hypothetical protein